MQILHDQGNELQASGKGFVGRVFFLRACQNFVSLAQMPSLLQNDHLSTMICIFPKLYFCGEVVDAAALTVFWACFAFGKALSPLSTRIGEDFGSPSTAVKANGRAHGSNGKCTFPAKFETS